MNNQFLVSNLQILPPSSLVGLCLRMLDLAFDIMTASTENQSTSQREDSRAATCFQEGKSCFQEGILPSINLLDLTSTESSQIKVCDYLKRTQTREDEELVSQYPETFSSKYFTDIGCSSKGEGTVGNH